MKSTNAPVRAATINDVAAAVGVSRQTVTRAMNNMAGISEQTKERVLTAARELHYRPSRFGRGLVKREHRTMGLVIDDLSNPYYPELASAVVGFAATAGWNVILADAVHAQDLPDLLGGLVQQVDAVVGYVDFTNEKSAAALTGVPFVQIDIDATVTDRGGVVLEYEEAMINVAGHLMSRDVSHLVMLDVSAEGQPSRRAQLFVEVLRRQGVTVPIVHVPDTGLEPAMARTGELLQGWPETDAILTFNDITAFGVLKKLRLLGVDVPGRIKVIGIDGLSIGTFVTPQLSTVALDMREVARAAVETVIAIESGAVDASDPAARPTVGHRLVVRESS